MPNFFSRFAISSSLKSLVRLYKSCCALDCCLMLSMFFALASFTASAFSSAALSVNPIQSVKSLKPCITALIGPMIALNTASSTPIFLRKNPIATTMAVITTMIKNIGLAKMVIPNLTNAPPTVVIVPTNPFILFAKSAGLSLPSALAKFLALSLASSKSKLINESLMPPIPLLTCSNLLPVAKTFTASLASLILSLSSPAL